MKKPKLSAALKAYQVQQLKVQKQKKHQAELEKLNPKNKPAAKEAAVFSEDHTPWHIWSDASGRCQQRTRLPFHPAFSSQILLCGEGDFSYCRALVEAFEHSAPADSQWRMVATTLDSRDTVIHKYHEKARSNLSFLESTDADRNQRLTILFGTDATRLHENKTITKLFRGRDGATGLPLTRIIFNFPHSGAGIKDRDRNILAQKKLLVDFFTACTKLAAALKISPGCDSNAQNRCAYSTTMMKKMAHREDVGEVVYKASSDKRDNEDEDPNWNYNQDFDRDNRGEAFEIHITLKTGEPYDSWKIKTLATSTRQIHCSQSFRFAPDSYPGYQHCRTIGGNELVTGDSWTEFLAGKPAKTFVFTFNK